MIYSVTEVLLYLMMYGYYIYTLYSLHALYTNVRSNNILPMPKLHVLLLTFAGYTCLTALIYNLIVVEKRSSVYVDLALATMLSPWIWKALTLLGKTNTIVYKRIEYLIVSMSYFISIMALSMALLLNLQKIT